VVRTNLLASSYCIEAALPLLRKGTAPHLVGVASSVTYLPLPGPKPTARQSRAALPVRIAAYRSGTEGIEVTVISPGFVDTPLTAKTTSRCP
jgi:NAD(P)-dependent dehydrogenase (short-subunit alcohol dehydrogenase family)